MDCPKISICMPTLNSEAYLKPRLESIRRQTLGDWELVVVDSQSDDNTLPIVEGFVKQGGNVRVFQGPRDGIYTNINRSIEYARGQYVYIATSDDTMADDCLEKMARALDTHENCGLAHCGLRLIDAAGQRVEDDFWPVRSTFFKSAGELVNCSHVRRAPYDGLLHLLGETVYVSLTQLLIRRSLFDRIGMFRSDWGSISDFYWDMRAALTTDTAHVGDTWASWRIHDNQATATAGIGQKKHMQKIESMMAQALIDSQGDLPAEVVGQLEAWQKDAKQLRAFLDRVKAFDRRSKRWLYITRELLKGSRSARRYLRGNMVAGESLPECIPIVVEKWLRSVGLEPLGERTTR